MSRQQARTSSRIQNSGGGADVVFTYGPSASTLAPLVGDWDGDGIETIGLYNPTTGAFFLKNSNAGGAADIVVQLWPRRRRLACRS